MEDGHTEAAVDLARLAGLTPAGEPEEKEELMLFLQGQECVLKTVSGPVLFVIINFLQQPRPNC